MPAAGPISSLERERTIGELESGAFDVVVVGGGITGAGIAREAALRGLSVALLEADDFASGTSSRSSKLIHGGLRYLALGDIELVRECALERKKLFALAPHLAEPRWMVLPTRSRAGLLKFRAAITTYEKLGAVEQGDVHRNWSAADLETEEPSLDRSRYRYACAYREYLTDDARLVLANLRAAVAGGGVVLNHARVVNIRAEGGRAGQVEAACAQTGRSFRVRAGCVINAAGPWVEAVRRLEDPAAAPLLHLSRGIHVVLPAALVPVRHLLLLNAADGRSVFIMRRGEIVFLGTTDTPHAGDAELWPEIGQADVAYLLEPLPRYLTIPPVRPDQVCAAWAGLRPLISQPGKKPTELSRRDEILVGPSGVVSVAGGKLTGYRPMAQRALEKAAEIAEKRLGERPEEGPLPGGDFEGDLSALERALAADFGLPERTRARLARLYGTEAALVCRLGATPLAEGAPVLQGEVRWSIEVEGATSVLDVLYRRTRAALYDPDVKDALVAPVAEQMAEVLGWDRGRTEAETALARARLGADLAFAAEAE
ncbi:MAG: glycerol-3-phosphate dehydrogenase/oxidase [Myxococcota bacterium]